MLTASWLQYAVVEVFAERGIKPSSLMHQQVYLP